MINKLFLKKKLSILVVFAVLVASLFVVLILMRGKNLASVEVEQQTEIVAPIQQQTANTVTVKVQSYISPEGKKCYQYTVENNAAAPVVGLDIGVEQASDQAELNTLPDGWSLAPEEDNERSLAEAVNSTSKVEAVATEEQVKYFVTTKAFRANPGETRGFYVCMQSDWDSTYQTAHWIAYMMGSSDLTGQVVNLGPM